MGAGEGAEENRESVSLAAGAGSVDREGAGVGAGAVDREGVRVGVGVGTGE